LDPEVRDGGRYKEKTLKEKSNNPFETPSTSPEIQGET